MSVGIIAGNVASITVIAQSVTPAEVSANTSAEQTFTVPGVKAGDALVVNPPGSTTGVTQGGVRVSAANTVAIQYINTTAGALTPPAGSHTITVVRFDGTAAAKQVIT